MRYRLGTLMIVLALSPPALAVGYLCWNVPHNFDIFELRVTALAAILAGVALAACFAVFWQKRCGGRPTGLNDHC